MIEQAGVKLKSFLCVYSSTFTNPPYSILYGGAFMPTTTYLSFLSANCRSASTSLPVLTGELGKGKAFCGAGRLG